MLADTLTALHRPHPARHAAAWASIVTRQAIRRGTFRSVKELTAAIGVFIDDTQAS